MMITAGKASKLRDEVMRARFRDNMSRLEPTIERETDRAATLIEQAASDGRSSACINLTSSDLPALDQRFVTGEVKYRLETAGFNVGVEPSQLRVSW